MDVEYPWEFDPQDDHPFWALDEDSFEETTRTSTVNMTAEEFVSAFVENKDKWEHLGVNYMMEFDEEYESEVDTALDEVLGNAYLRADGVSDKEVVEAQRDTVDNDSVNYDDSLGQLIRAAAKYSREHYVGPSEEKMREDVKNVMEKAKTNNMQNIQLESEFEM